MMQPREPTTHELTLRRPQLRFAGSIARGKNVRPHKKTSRLNLRSPDINPVFGHLTFRHRRKSNGIGSDIVVVAKYKGIVDDCDCDQPPHYSPLLGGNGGPTHHKRVLDALVDVADAVCVSDWLTLQSGCGLQSGGRAPCNSGAVCNPGAVATPGGCMGLRLP